MRNLLAAACFCAYAASALAAEPSPSADQPRITVTGEALVYAKPDKIILNSGSRRGTTSYRGEQKNDAMWKKAAAVLKESGVPNKEVQTDYLSIEPRYRNDKRSTSRSAT